MIVTGDKLHQVAWGDFTRTLLVKMARTGRPLPNEALELIKGIPKPIKHTPLQAYVNHGRWVVDCPFCTGAELAFENEPHFICLSCFNAEVDYKPIKVKFPKERQAIEDALDIRPIIEGRNWKPSQTVAELLEANKLKLEGWHHSFQAPRTWTTSEIVTAAMMNQDVRDNMIYVKAEVDKLDDVSASEPSRALGSTYQNTSGKILLVSIQCKCDVAESSGEIDGYSYVTIYCDANSTPTTARGRIGIYPAEVLSDTSGELSAMGQFFLVVPPSHYYRAIVSTGGGGQTPTLDDWHEWELH